MNEKQSLAARYPPWITSMRHAHNSSAGAKAPQLPCGLFGVAAAADPLLHRDNCRPSPAAVSASATSNTIACVTIARAIFTSYRNYSNYDNHRWTGRQAALGALLRGR